MIIKVGNIEVDSRELASAERQRWLQSLHKTDIPIHCTCNPDATMHIYRSKNGNYSIRTNRHKLQEHDEFFCEFRLDLRDDQMKGQHYRAIEEIGPNELSMSTKHLGIFIKDATAAEQQPRKQTVNLAKAQITNSGITLGSLGRELLSRAWESSITKYRDELQFYPSMRGILFHLHNLFVRGEIRVNLTNKLTLDKVLWIGQKKPGSVFYANRDAKIRPILLCQLDKASVQYDEELKRYTLDVIGVNNEPIAVEIAKSDWAHATDCCRVSYDKHEHFFIIGLAISQAYNCPLKLEKVELIPTTKRGMFVDSSYEKLLFERFENQRRIYIRMNQRMDELQGYLPDAILLDTEKPCIVEVFGMSESVQAYHEAKQRKIAFYKSLDIYSTYYWYAYKGGKPPYFPSPKIVQSKH